MEDWTVDIATSSWFQLNSLLLVAQTIDFMLLKTAAPTRTRLTSVHPPFCDLIVVQLSFL